ncbi:MAG: hypothetical protein ACOYY2_01185 [Actinomycetota bacterium]
MLVNSGPGAISARTRRFPTTRSGLLLPAALLLAVASPFLVGAGHALLAGQPTAFLGDQALTELDTRDALAGRQVVGLYSRFGWAHPGPAWLYLLAGPYQLAGRTAAALTAAVMLVHLLAALALVVAASRPLTGGRSRLVLVLSVVGVLAFVAAAPPMTFTSVWNPFALLLPTALFVVLAGQAAAGSGPALAWAFVTGSALVQTHLGTAPLVAGLALLATLPTVLRAARRRPLRWWPRRPPRPGVLVPLLLLAAMWLPPLVEQVRGPQHNLSRLVLFFLAPAEGGHSWGEAADVVSRALVAYPLLRPLPYQPAQSTPGPLAAAFLGAYLSAAAALVLWGRRRHLPAVTASGAANLLAPLVAVLAVRRIDGPVYSYLVTWVSALPLALFLGYAAAAAAVVAGPLTGHLAWGVRRRRALAAVALTGVLGLVGWDLVALYQLPPSAYGSRSASELALAALPPARPGAVVGVDLVNATDWQVAAGLAAQLERAGWRVRVPPDLRGIFGADRVETGHPPLTLFVGPANRTPPAPARLLGVVPSELGPTAVYLRN